MSVDVRGGGSTEIVAVDIGGTHARFAIARVAAGERPRIEHKVKLKTAEHASLNTAWQAYAREVARPLPQAAAICIAAPLGEDTVKLTNSPWVLTQSTLAESLGLEQLVLLNDFGAMAYAVATLNEDELEHICGPDEPLPTEGVTTVLGPGTGLGVAMLIRGGGRDIVVETEGGHVDYAPLDRLESGIVDRLRERYLRVSTERVVSGPGLANIYDALAELEEEPVKRMADAELWAAALRGEPPLARAALDRFVLSLGAVAGDLALAQGASAVVLTGGLAQRIKDDLRRPEFALRFCAKGRFQSYMAQLPVRLVVHAHPGLLGAAAAFVARRLS